MESVSYKDWDYLYSRSLSTIRLSLEEDVLFNIVGEETTTCLWSKMESIYMTKSLTNEIYMKRLLYSLHMQEGIEFANHLNFFNTLICQLSSMEVIYKDEEKEVTLLCSLPKSWDHLVTSMWFSTTDSIDY